MKHKPFLLLMSDAVGGGAVDDPLAMPAGQVDTSFPRMQPDRVYKMLIRSPEIVASKSNDKNFMLVMKLETTEDGTDTDGNKLYKGFKFTHRIGITPSGERTATHIGKDLALLLQALNKTSISARALVGNPATGVAPELHHIADQLIYVKVGLQKATNDFPESNKVTKFIPPSEAKK
jgi:hypothetical protein